MTVIDLGCGYVHSTIPVAIAVGIRGNVVAIEKLNEGWLEEAGVQNVELIDADHKVLPGAMQNQADFLMMYDLIHHSPRKEMLQAAVECLKPGAIFVSSRLRIYLVISRPNLNRL